MPRWTPGFVVGLASALSTPALADDGYAGLVRDILIVQQCAMADEVVEAGFRLEAQALIESAAVTAAGAAEARQRGEAEYRRTWRDRGQGPVDARCRRDGAALAAAFRAYIMAE
jgi:hypothetical protein